MKFRIAFFVLLLTANYFAQTVITTSPTYPTQNDKITLTFDVTKATHQNAIAGYTGRVFAHTGVTLVTNNGTPQRWQKVIGNWGDNNLQPELTRTGTNIYQLTINSPRNFYSVSDPSQKITELCLVIRSSDGSKQTEDLFVPLYFSGISVVLNSPSVNTTFGDPLRSPVFVSAGGTVPISANTSEVGTKTKSITLFVNRIQKYQSVTNSLSYTFAANDNPAWKNEIKIIAADTANVKDSVKFTIVKNPAIKNLPLPAGNQIGINYGSDPTQSTLAIYAPQKNFIYVLGDFNDWKTDTTFFMNRYEPKPDSVIWWTTLSNLSIGKEYGYQYLIDGNLRVQDAYAEKILDPSNDPSISPAVTPSYPSGKTQGIVSVLQTAAPKYTWKIDKFTRPSKDKLVIYELLVRDFVTTHSYVTLKDTLGYFKKLGVNAIELMPVNEFEGNNSWGYNPMQYMALDKYYGSKNELKAFIDACHDNGIAVLMDIVLNHAYGSNPMVRMYFENGKPAANNPWFNQQSNFQLPDAQWGYDFNHESKATQYHVDRILQYWLTEYKMDGFRFDFTKGFGNNIKDRNSDPWGSKYDADRIRLLERMVSHAWSYDPTAIMIFEHLADNSEETELANYGILLWGNMNYNYNEATMGWIPNSNFSNVSYKLRGWSQPNLVGYMESHDEERLMYKNITYGNTTGSYNVKDLNTALQRMKLAGAFFITVPGPKMIWQFGELGYDISIDQGGRLSNKPILWNYLNSATRKNLMKVWSTLINLKKNYPAFSSTDFTLSTSVGLKRIKITHSSMNVVIVGNFDVTAGSLVTDFQNAGKWYNYFTGEELNVTDTGMSITLQPGEFRIYTSVKLPTPEQGILSSINDEQKLPTEFQLDQNYPNPFNPATTINYQIAENSFVQLKVYDVIGREVATLVNEIQQPGTYRSTFSIQNSVYSSGVYFYTLRANNFVQTKKMILLK